MEDKEGAVMRVARVKTLALLLLMSAGITTCGRDRNSDKPRIPFPVHFPPPTDNPGDDDDDGSTEPPGNGCVYGQGYWKNHSDVWPVEALVIADESYNKEELLALFNTPTHGDKSLILARQHVAALLNVANGAGTAAVASEVLAASEQWMTVCKDEDGRLPYGTSHKRDDSETYSCSKSAKHLSGLLDLYNKGKLGTPSCECKDGEDDNDDEDDDD